MIGEIQASDQWNYYQAKGIKASVLSTRLAVLTALGKPVSKADQDKLEAYDSDQETISEKAKEKEHESEAHLGHHQILARSVTFFQVAITLGAIAVLVRRRRFWLVSLGFGFVGLGFFIQGLFS